MKNKFLFEMQARGYLNQCTDLVKLSEICNKKSITGYIGFDCTASSLHVRQPFTNYDFEANATTRPPPYSSTWWRYYINW